MKLRYLIAALEGASVLPPGDAEREVTDVAHDSRKVKDGSLFVAVRGFHSDGHHFIVQAVKQGAVAIVAEEGGLTEDVPGVPIIRVRDSRRALAQIAAVFHGHPSRKLKLVGITGTNGKTTTSYLVKSIIEAGRQKAGLIGTIGYRIGNRIYPAPNTTPESLDLQQLLSELVSLGATHCIMEVSSHALALGRTEGCTFAAAAFTNLTQDHLDFHKDMESYFRAKLLLFTGLSEGAAAVVNWDDGRAAEIIRNTRARVVTYGLMTGADVRITGQILHRIDGLAFDVSTPSGIVSVRSPLVGRHNVSNILASVGVGVALGFPADAISRGICAMTSVPGRMEKVDEGQGFGVLVDYAHTEDALVRLLEAVRDVAKGAVITVFGCGGDRDRTKRPKMGAAAVNGSDLVIVTSDNPRTEDPLAIIREIEAGIREAGAQMIKADDLSAAAGKRSYLLAPDRHEAIGTAIAMAKPGDIVVLAGKGHEDYQIIGDRKLPFNDREEARKALRKRQVAGYRVQA